MELFVGDKARGVRPTDATPVICGCSAKFMFERRYYCERHAKDAVFRSVIRED